jgi:hypothetical protein
MRRARVHLDYIVTQIGPHPIGSTANRNATKQYILSQLQLIADQVLPAYSHSCIVCFCILFIAVYFVF